MNFKFLKNGRILFPGRELNNNFFADNENVIYIAAGGIGCFIISIILLFLATRKKKSRNFKVEMMGEGENANNKLRASALEVDDARNNPRSMMMSLLSRLTYRSGGVRDLESLPQRQNQRYNY